MEILNVTDIVSFVVPSSINSIVQFIIPLKLFPTALVREVMHYLCPFPLHLSNSPTFDLYFCMCVGAIMAHWGFKLKVAGQGQDAVCLISILNRGQFSSL